jgi:phosphatidylserine/phosphatidylglycerophosphate/cardiolipin synthase-like enzyme
MSDLAVCFGPEARVAICQAFDCARRSISAEFYDLKDGAVRAALARAKARGVVVDVRTEHRRHSFDSHAVLHAKAAVIDERTAIVTTANVTRSGFDSPGEVCVVDDQPDDVRALSAAIAGLPKPACSDERIVSGPGTALRDSVAALLSSPSDLRIASEDLSDERVVEALIARLAAGHLDRVLINDKGALSREQRRTVCRLNGAGVAVHAPVDAYMHEKYVDDGDRIYVGSANLTRNGLDEGIEIGVVAPACDFGIGAADLRANFDALWSASPPVSCS